MKHIFIVGIALITIIAAASVFFLYRSYLKAECLQGIMARSRPAGMLLAFLPLLCCLFFLAFNTSTAFVALIHLFAISFSVKLIFAILEKLFHFSVRNDLVMGMGILLTVTVLLCGWFTMHNIRKTEYTVYTDKSLPENGLKIALISDVHLSTCVDGNGFAGLTARIADDNPDLLLICGDLIDDSSKASDLDGVATALKNISPRLGKWYVYGNHDAGSRGFGEIPGEALSGALTGADVGILEDETVELDGITLIGRKDASDKGRKSAAELTDSVQDDRFILIMNHQPTDYANESATNADLVLSGHTHGGQMFPAGQLGMLMGANDRLYGSEVRNGTTFIVSSGVAGWAIPFKTGTVSEYVLIHVLPAA